ncbi:methylated-DNA--[protein]-cysteine S-methyltransferase [Bacillus tianshenii]|nr:methylated-DNA--[protein]-cysteine S-methyltransferase [Bacillus tianshenii]
MKKYYAYQHSPIGLIEICTNESVLLSVDFVEKKQSSAANPPLILENAYQQLQEYFRAERKTFDLEVALDGTDFQKKVWNGLRDIPYGEVWSYKKLATNIGNEKAVRAVGNANSKNLISIIIPCHRVIGANGTLTGYAGGLDRKKWLLEHEKSI